MHKKLSEKLINICDKKSGYKKQIVLKTFALPNGLVETFFIDKGKDSVEIFAITNDKKIVVVKQFRAGNEKEQMNRKYSAAGLSTGGLVTTFVVGT